MKPAVGSIPMYTLIAVFLVIILSFLAAIISYYKAFKLNSRITSVVERCEGYNSCSEGEIKRLLKNFSYTVKNEKDGGPKCPTEEGGQLLDINVGLGVCFYYFANEGTTDRYSYGVTTFLTWDFPIIHQFVRMPIFSKTDRLYKFE